MKQYFDYLDDLQEIGSTPLNRFYELLQYHFDISASQAWDIFQEWKRNNSL